MCNHCKLKTINKEIGEKTNNGNTFLKVRDGHQIIEISMDRYIVESEDIHRRQITMSLGVGLSCGTYTVIEKSTPIMYCPFCGEKL